MTDPQKLISIAVGTEPPLDLDWAELTSVGNTRVRRRRTLTVVIGTAAVAALLAGSTLLISTINRAGPDQNAGVDGASVSATGTNTNRPTGPPTISSVAIAGCEVVYGPTGELPPQPTSAPSSSVAAPASGDSLPIVDLQTAPDPLTQVLWDRLASWNIRVFEGSVFGSLTFATDSAPGSGAFNSTGGADGRLSSASGDGELSIQIGPDQDGVPPCRVGELDQRITNSDGTVIDVKRSTGMMQSSSGDQSGPFTTISATAHHPDGTLTVVSSSNAVPRHDDDDVSSGLRPSGGVPLSTDQITQLASDPDLRRTSDAAEAAYAQWSAVVPNVVGMTEDQARVALTALGFTISVKYQLIESGTVAEGVAAGSVAEQSPEPGRSRTPGTSVTLTIAVNAMPSTTTGG